nr:hypothetical protein [Streptomyces daqingensis]
MDGDENGDGDENVDGEEGGPHNTSTVERGSFSYARCSCGWAGPARRARGTSRADAAAHGARGTRGA